MSPRRGPVSPPGSPAGIAPSALLALSLELEKRPILLMDAERRVLAANSAMSSLLKRSLETLAGSDVETLLAPDSVVAFRNAVETALPGRDRCFDANFVATHGPLIPSTTRLAGVRIPGSEHPAYFLTLMEVHCDIETVVLANGIAYLVSSENRDFGHLKMVWGMVTGRLRVELIGRRCFEVFFGRQEPCAGCPVFARRIDGSPTSCVLPSTWSPDGMVEVVSARATSETAIAVTRWPVGQNLVSSLVANKIDRIIANAQLSTQEGEVLHLLLLGRSIAEIAQEMGIVERTAKYHQRKVLRKIGAESRLDVSRLLL